MKKLSIPFFIIIGLAFWGVPAFFVAGTRAVIFALVVILPVWWLNRSKTEDTERSVDPKISPGTSLVLVVFTLTYLIFDGLVGRQLLTRNMFIFGSDAVNSFMDQANTHISEGRGIVDLIGACVALLPFALIDSSRRVAPIARWCLGVTAIVAIFYEAGISRGYLLMALFALGLGRAVNKRRLLWAGALSVVGFGAASLYRGDFNNIHFSNPLFDSVVFPFINLKMLVNSGCGSGQWYEFLGEFFKKFLPAFLFPKTIFSFNLEMTACIYPFFGKTVDSISIFTYLGEIFYYQPSIVTALVSGLILGTLARVVDRTLVRCDLLVARVFAGMMCIVLLRSRIQDVMSFLLAQVLFLLLWTFLCGFGRLLHLITRHEMDSWAPETYVRL